jgi:hypothetical protein
MRRLFLLIGLGACASTPSASESSNVTAARPVIVITDRIIEGERPRAAVAMIAASPAAAWPVVKKVYQALGIDVTVDNVAAHQLGNQNFWKTRMLGGHRMSEFVDCGSGMTGLKADLYRIYISLLTTVNPDGQGGTKLETLFLPVGQDVTGGSTDRIPCGSTGGLEALIHESVRATLGK